MNKENRNFTDAYKVLKGHKWNWKKEDGTKNHPLLDGDEATQNFYRGWILAKRGQNELLEMKVELERVNSKLKEMEKKFKLFFDEE